MFAELHLAGTILFGYVSHIFLFLLFLLFLLQYTYTEILPTVYAAFQAEREGACALRRKSSKVFVVVRFLILLNHICAAYRMDYDEYILYPNIKSVPAYIMLSLPLSLSLCMLRPFELDCLLQLLYIVNAVFMLEFFSFSTDFFLALHFPSCICW